MASWGDTGSDQRAARPDGMGPPVAETVRPSPAACPHLSPFRQGHLSPRPHAYGGGYLESHRLGLPPLPACMPPCLVPFPTDVHRSR